jgi:hypothetical protein
MPSLHGGGQLDSAPTIEFSAASGLSRLRFGRRLRRLRRAA